MLVQELNYYKYYGERGENSFFYRKGQFRNKSEFNVLLMDAMKYWMLNYNAKKIDIKFVKNVNNYSMKIQYAPKF